MRWSTAEKVNAGFAIALGIVTLIGVASLTSIQRFAATARDVSDTHNALTQLQSVLVSLSNAESAQRGFVITGDARYHEPIEFLSRTSIRQLQELRAKTYADNDQQQRLAVLGTLAAERIRLMNEVVTVRGAQGVDAAAELVRAGRGKLLMDSIQSLARDFELTELRRLDSRSRSAALRARVATGIIAGGGVFAFLVVLVSGTVIRRDYTERRRAELALRESETLLSQFMENLPIGVIVVDAQWRPRFANNAAVDILGPTILIDDGAHPLPLYRAGDRRPYPPDQTPLALALNGRTATIDDAMVRVGDRYVPIHVSAAPIYDASGRIAYTIAAFSDVTDRKRAEAALHAAKDAAETASRTKSDFLARMSHELRTPLNSVIGFANILLKNKAGNLRDQDAAYLHRIFDNGKHLLLLINDILDLSKIEAGKIEVENEPIDLRELVEDIASQFDVHVRDRPVELRVQVPAGMAPLTTDPARLRQVLINLIGNAVKFTERGHVTITVDVEASTARPARLRVIDTGVGIPEGRLGAIFDAFEQAESTTSRKFGGTGLGLPISRALCELLGFTLSVRSRAGAGTEFIIDMMPAGTRVDEVPQRSVAGGQSARAAAGGERLVLIVDDESDSRILLTHYVEEFGCRAIATHSATSALTLARELRPDLITLDLMMPGLNGWDMLAALKEDPELAAIPVVIVSIIAQESRATLLGAIDLVEKPVERSALFSALERNLGTRRARVLIIDDSRDSRALLEELVAPVADEVRSAPNGQDALKLLREFEPDVVLLDLLMPVMDGLTFLEVFRSAPRFQHVPVIVVSAKDLSGEERDRVERHTAAVLKKGNALEADLKRALGAVLQHEPAGSADRPEA
jgi:signal transduction histidine kinase/CheY-like chemotaxis protein